jgi:hypothetical protein
MADGIGLARRDVIMTYVLISLGFFLYTYTSIMGGVARTGIPIIPILN